MKSHTLDKQALIQHNPILPTIVLRPIKPKIIATSRCLNAIVCTKFGWSYNPFIELSYKNLFQIIVCMGWMGGWMLQLLSNLACRLVQASDKNDCRRLPVLINETCRQPFVTDGDE